MSDWGWQPLPWADAVLYREDETSIQLSSRSSAKLFVRIDLLASSLGYLSADINYKRGEEFLLFDTLWKFLKGTGADGSILTIRFSSFGDCLGSDLSEKKTAFGDAVKQVLGCTGYRLKNIALDPRQGGKIDLVLELGERHG